MTPREKAIIELVRLSEEEQRGADFIAQEEAATGKPKNKIFQKYMIKDVVFLAIITCCTLVTGAIMPLLVNGAAVRHNTVGTRITVFAVSRYRNDES